MRKQCIDYIDKMTDCVAVVRYAGTVMEVYKVNEELNSQLREVSQFTAQFSAEAGKKYN